MTNYTEYNVDIGELIQAEFQRLQTEQRIAQIDNGTADLQEHGLVEE